MIALELRKEKRTGMVAVLLVSGVIGAVYVLLNFAIRGPSLLAMPVPPMDILLTQLYGMLMVLNMFSVIVATSIAYNMEYSGFAIKKMYVLPIPIWKIYVAKFCIIMTTFLVSILLEYCALGWIGVTTLGPGVFEGGTFLAFLLYTYVTSLPVASAMLLVSSLSENIWVTLGIGVGGFLSGMALVNLNTSNLMLLHPFILMLKPAVAMSASVNPVVVGIALAEVVLYFCIGVYASIAKKVE